MTFEEFFIKKKIDLTQLKQAEPILFEEFRHDFSQMGEKSFDHTKKYWFNKLRRSYHLRTEPKEQLPKPEAAPLAAQAEPLSSPTIAEKPGGYTPRFKPRVTQQPKQEETAEKDVTATAAQPSKPEAPDTGILPDEGNKAAAAKPAYKPRFNAGAIKKDTAQPTESAPSNETTTSPEPAEQAPKPAYKPRFNASAIKKTHVQPTEQTSPDEINNPSEPAEQSAKPAYKPRFKPGMLNRPKPNDDNTEA